LAMLSKESGMAALGMMVAYDLWLLRFGPSSAVQPSAQASARRRAGWQYRLRRLALQRWLGLIVVALIVLTIRMQVLGRLAQDRVAIDKMDNPVASASTVGRVLTPVVLLGKAVRLLVWPDPMCHDYSYNAIPICESLLDTRLLWGALCIAAAVAACVHSYRRKGWVLAGVGMFVLSYALVSNSVILSGTIFAERLLYMPSVGFCWLVSIGVISAASGLSKHFGSPSRGWLLAGCPFALLCTIHVFLAIQRGREWVDEPSLIASALRVTDDSARLHLQAGFHAELAKDYARALRHFRRVVEIMDDHASGHYQLGRVYVLTGRPAEAIPHLFKAFGQLPAEANHLAAYYLARAYAKTGDKQEAAKWRARAKALKPR
jgi:protein O-mannosyl-transferase